jgi:hypothetical protein
LFDLWFCQGHIGWGHSQEGRSYTKARTKEE